MESDRIRILDLPQDGGLLKCAKSIESAMKAGTSVDARRACAEFLALASGFYRVSTPGIRVLAARPLKARKVGLLSFSAMTILRTTLIRLWMRTAVRKVIYLFRNIPEHPVPRILPSPRLSAFTISRIHGTLAVSTSALLRCTTMHGEHRQSDCSGCQYRAGAGGSIGRERIAVRDFRGQGRQLFVFDIPERQVNSWLNHARFLGYFMLEMFLRIASHD